MAEQRTVMVGPRVDRRRKRGIGWWFAPVFAGIAAFFLSLPPHDAANTVRLGGKAGSFAFKPASLEIAAGQTVTFTNDTRVTHTATCDGCPRDTGDVQPSLRRGIRFSTPGTYTIFCRYHRDTDQMEMTVEVG